MATKTALGPKKGRTPDFSGVPGQLVAMPSFELHFGARARVSPYDALLTQLESAAPKNQVLVFGDMKARASVNVRAKKLGIRVLFAEADGKLYVKFGGYVPDSDRFKRVVRERILDVIQTNPRNPGQIAVELRKQGLEEIDAQLVDTIVKQMEQAGLVGRKGDGTWGKK